MPKRPLSAYNIFFKSERQGLLGEDVAKEFEVTEASKRKHRKTHGKIGFADMARAISLKWKKLDPEARRPFEEQAKVERARYTKAINEYRKSQMNEKKGSVQRALSECNDLPQAKRQARQMQQLLPSSRRVQSEPEFSGETATGTSTLPPPPQTKSSNISPSHLTPRLNVNITELMQNVANATRDSRQVGWYCADSHATNATGLSTPYLPPQSATSLTPAASVLGSASLFRATVFPSDQTSESYLPPISPRSTSMPASLDGSSLRLRWQLAAAAAASAREQMRQPAIPFHSQQMMRPAGNGGYLGAAAGPLLAPVGLHQNAGPLHHPYRFPVEQPSSERQRMENDVVALQRVLRQNDARLAFDLLSMPRRDY